MLSFLFQWPLFHQLTPQGYDITKQAVSRLPTHKTIFMKPKPLYLSCMKSMNVCFAIIILTFYRV